MKHLVFLMVFIVPGAFAGVKCGNPTSVTAIKVNGDGQIHWSDGNRNSHIAWTPDSKMDAGVAYGLLSDAMKNDWDIQSLYPDGYQCKGYASDRSEPPIWLNVSKK
jgi:hypothetical protein